MKRELKHYPSVTRFSTNNFPSPGRATSATRSRFRERHCSSRGRLHAEGGKKRLWYSTLCYRPLKQWELESKHRSNGTNLGFSSPQVPGRNVFYRPWGANVTQMVCPSPSGWRSASGVSNPAISRINCYLSLALFFPFQPAWGHTIHIAPNLKIHLCCQSNSSKSCSPFDMCFC